MQTYNDIASDACGDGGSHDNNNNNNKSSRYPDLVDHPSLGPVFSPLLVPKTSNPSTTTLPQDDDFVSWSLDPPHYNVFPKRDSVIASGHLIHTTPQSRHGLYQCHWKDTINIKNCGVGDSSSSNDDSNETTNRNGNAVNPSAVPSASDAGGTAKSNNSGFDCVVQGDELFHVLTIGCEHSKMGRLLSSNRPVPSTTKTSSTAVLRITDLTTGASSSKHTTNPIMTTDVLPGDVIFARTKRKVRWEFVCPFTCNDDLNDPTSSGTGTTAVTGAVHTSSVSGHTSNIMNDHSIDANNDQYNFLKVFYGFKKDGYTKRATTIHDDDDDEDNIELAPMIHFLLNDLHQKDTKLKPSNHKDCQDCQDRRPTSYGGFQRIDPIDIPLEHWPLTNPKSGYKILDGTNPKTFGTILDAQSFQLQDEDDGNKTVEFSTRMGLWKCTPGKFECTEQGDELMTVVRGLVTITDVLTRNTQTVKTGQTVFLQHHGRRVIWDVPNNNKEDDGHGVLKIFYGSIQGTY